eukprot:jgi/Hompol1/69/HPOL_003906-RA
MAIVSRPKTAASATVDSLCSSIRQNPSLWDKLPNELKEYILEWAGPLTQFINGRLKRERLQHDMQLMRRLWRDVYVQDWQGDLGLLPQGGQSTDDLYLVHTRSMLARLLAHYPHSDRFFRHVPMANCWLDLVDLSRPVSVVSLCIRHGYVTLLAHVLVHARLIGPDSVRVFSSDNLEDDYSINAIDKAAELGRLESVKWLHMFLERYVRETRRTELRWCTTRAMDLAARSGRLDIVQWLHENRQEGCTTWAMDLAARYGHIKIVKWLHEHRTEGCSERAITMALRFKHWDIVKFLLSSRTETHTASAVAACILADEDGTLATRRALLSHIPSSSRAQIRLSIVNQSAIGDSLHGVDVYELIRALQ